MVRSILREADNEGAKPQERLNPRLLGSEELRRRVDAVLSRGQPAEPDVRAQVHGGRVDGVDFLRELRRWAAAVRGSRDRAG